MWVLDEIRWFLKLYLKCIHLYYVSPPSKNPGLIRSLRMTVLTCITNLILRDALDFESLWRISEMTLMFIRMIHFISKVYFTQRMTIN